MSVNYPFGFFNIKKSLKTFVIKKQKSIFAISNPLIGE